MVDTKKVKTRIVFSFDLWFPVDYVIGQVGTILVRWDSIHCENPIHCPACTSHFWLFSNTIYVSLTKSEETLLLSSDSTTVTIVSISFNFFFFTLHWWFRDGGAKQFATSHRSCHCDRTFIYGLIGNVGWSTRRIGLQLLRTIRGRPRPTEAYY